MRLSLIVPVLNSHEILRRQLCHFERIGLPEGVELILVDDGSDPPIENTSSLPVTIHRTHDKRPWTWALARNAGARLAKGDVLLMYDLDHIVSKGVLDFVIGHPELRIGFRREFGVLTEDGQLTQDRGILATYGLPESASLQIHGHQNSFAMRRDLFWELGGYREDLIGRPYPQGEDTGFFKTWKAYRDAHDLVDCTGSALYHFPNGRFCGDVDYNPQGLFHDLSRKSRRNPYWLRQREEEHHAVR
jgi:glycosyltransferase involved in cell wall biosynthesis